MSVFWEVLLKSLYISNIFIAFFNIFLFISIFFFNFFWVFLAETIENLETSRLKQNVKQNTRKAIQDLHLEIKKEGKPQIFYFYDKTRAELDEIYMKQGQFSKEKPSLSLFSEEKDDGPLNLLEVFLDFESTPVENQGYLLDFALKVLLNPVENQENRLKSEEFLYVRLQNFYVPAKEYRNFTKISLKF